MNSTAIHTAIPEDAALIAPLFDAYRQFYEQPADADAALAFITARLERGESVILLARRPDGSALGFCQLYPSFCSVLAAPIYVLYDLFVVPEGAAWAWAAPCCWRPKPMPAPRAMHAWT